MAATDASGETAMLPGMIEMVMCIGPAGIVAYPTIVLSMNVRRLRVPWLVGEGTPLRSWRGSMRGRPQWCRAVGRNVTAAHSSLTPTPDRGSPVRLAASTVMLLRKHWNRKQKNRQR
jgi:hypothetical protein